MADVKERVSQDEPTFTVDGEFLKREAKDALKSYFMPLSGIYAAVTGRDVEIVHRDKRGRILKRSAHK
jgi:hypothetical protein